MKNGFFWALLFSVQLSSLGQTPKPSPSDLFEKIKALKGTWEGHSERGGDTTLEYRIVGRGSAVLEDYAESAADGDKMETLYYLEGGELMLRHYCVARNQPRMKLATFDSKQDKLLFEFVDGTNIKPRDGHMHQIILQFVDPTTLINGATYFKDDKFLFSESTTYRRRVK